MDGHLVWDAQEMASGEKVPEDDSLVTVPVDASQLYAIRAAAEGKSFVLHAYNFSFFLINDQLVDLVFALV